MKAQDLLAPWPVVVGFGPPPDARDIVGVTLDSRTVSPGMLFVALPGNRTDGRDHAAAAVASGAVAVLAEGVPPANWSGAPWWQLENLRAVLGPIAKRTYGAPDADLTTVGITGTNGKSTLVALMAAILDHAGLPCGRLGTLGYRFGEATWPGERTTPEATALWATLAGMRVLGAKAAALEVSSHALALGRVAALDLDVAVLTNVTRDHLDFHGSMEAYAATKEHLVDLVRPGGSLVAALADEPSRAIAARWETARPGRVWTVGAGGRIAITAADWRLDGSRIELTIDGSRQLELTTKLRGAWNGENIALATAAALALGIADGVLTEALAAVAPLPGRLEPIEAGQPFAVFIDYAHTPEALAASLKAVRAMGARRILTVFGCGGDRDRGKRPVMGRLVGELADLAVATTDNPRSEDPHAILAEVEVGLRASGSTSYRIIPDRAEAIRGALATAEVGDVVVIAGKGHESFQLVGDRRLPFSDRDVARATLEGRHGGAVAR